MLISFILISNSDERLFEAREILKSVIEKTKINAEVIVSIGNSPSKQRNEAVQKANGEWLYFLDDDSIINEVTINQFLLTKNLYGNADVIGGPSVLPRPADIFQESVQFVFSSDFGIGPLKSRYYSHGLIRETTEKELILCNMAIKKETFLKLGGFNENLYPNEENEFLARVAKYKMQIIYSPLMYVERQHRKNFKELADQMINYGKGRTRHFLFSKNYRDYIYFAPMMCFLIVVNSLIFKKYFLIEKYLLGLYFAIIIIQSLLSSIYSKSSKKFFNTAAVFIICHMAYTLGLILGFFESKNKKQSYVKVDLVFSSTRDV